MKTFIKSKLYLFVLLIVITSCKITDNSVAEFTAISIGAMPEKTVYYQNEKLDLTGLIIYSIYSDGKCELIDDYSITPEKNTILEKIGKQKINIFYKNKTTCFYVNVIENNTKPFEILSQFKRKSFLLYEDKKMPTLQFQYKTHSKGELNIYWYKKAISPKESDELVFSTGKQSIFTDDELIGISEYILPTDEFTEHEVGIHSFYALINFKDEDKDLYYKTESMELEVSFPETGLMTFEINTESGEDPTGVYLKTLGLTNQPVVADKEKVAGSIKIFQNGVLLYDGDLKIKLRGNGSAYLEKKPYKIKLNEKVDLLFTDDSNNKDKDWCLLADGHSLDTPFGFEMSKLCRFDWVPEYRYVDLILNNTYRGTYLLTESIKASKNRISLSKDGYLLEGDGKVVIEANYNKIVAPPVWFKTTKNQYYSFKYPDDDDITAEQLEYIKDVMNDMEESITEGTYESTIDVNSFARWFLVHDIIGQADAGETNRYYSKYDNKESSKIRMSTPWDFQNGYIRKSVNSWTRFHVLDNYSIKQLFESDNKAFIEEFKSEWQNIEPTLYEDCMNYFDDFSNKYSGSIDKSRILDGMRWQNTRNTVAEDIDDIDDWLQKRIKWIDENIDSL